MFAGHYGVALALKGADKRVSLGTLFVAVMLADILFVVLVLLGVEKIEIVPGITAASPLDLLYYPFSHSLTASIVWAAVACAVYRLAPGAGRRGALIVGAAVLSHFLLDLIVHRPDLPLLLDDSYKVGLGLWNHVTASYLAEAALLAGGLWIYLRATTGKGFCGRYGVVILMVVLLLLSAANFAGPPPPSVTALAVSGLAGYVVITGAAFWLDGKRR